VCVFAQAFWSTNPEADKIRSVQKQVDDVKDIMMENIGTPAPLRRRCLRAAMACADEPAANDE
jgi:hypothetical protein